MTTDWREYLHGRGIEDATIARYALKGGITYDERDAIQYPVYQWQNPTIGTRYKFTDGIKPKVKSQSGMTQDLWPYYGYGDLTTAINSAAGLLYHVSGEPDVWTLHSVRTCGEKAINAICFLGEGNIPAPYVANMQQLGAKQIYTWPDLDERGMKTAHKISQLLKDSGITFVARRLPGEMGSKRDLNQVWQDVGFDRDEFWNVLMADSAALTEADLYLYAETSAPRPKQESLFNRPEITDLYRQWIDTIRQALGPYALREGNVERWHCPLPSHADENPSFTVKEGDTIPMPICTCGIQEREATDAWNEVARALHVDTWDEFKARHLASKPVSPSSNGAKPPTIDSTLDTLYVDRHLAYKELYEHLALESVPNIEFVDFPLKVLHGYDGFARLMWPGKLIYMVGISGGGKAQPLDSLVLSDSGWLRMGDIQIGDCVATMDGSFAPVIGVFPQGEKPIYRIRFTDGAEVECCDDHLWYVKSYGDRANHVSWRVKALHEFRKIHQKTHPSGKLSKTTIPVVEPIEYPIRPLPLDPYLLGVLIGDGGLTHSSPMISSADADILTWVEDALPEGVWLKHSAAYDYRITTGKFSGRANRNPVTVALRDLELWNKGSHEKHIPSQYLFSDVNSRLALLQGLLDTDGCAAGGHGTYIEYCTSSPQLAQDMKALTFSLGGTATITEKETPRRLAYRCRLSFPPSIHPFRLQRKMARYKTRSKYPVSRYIESIEYIGVKEAQCIAVGHPSQSYVTNDYVVTHNTSLAEVCASTLLRQGLDFVWYGPEWTPYEMALRELQRQGGMNAIRVAQGLQWAIQEKRGIPAEHRRGSPFPEASRQQAMSLIGSILAWPGRAYDLNPKANALSFDDQLNIIRQIVAKKRSEGRRVVSLFWDYLQRTNLPGRGANAFWSEEVADRLKSLCEELSLIGWVIVQPRKNDSRDVRAGDTLDEQSGQGISDQKCNLYLSVQPVYDENRVRQDVGKICIVKNSMGRLGEVEVPTDFGKLLWYDEVAVHQHVDLNQHLGQPGVELAVKDNGQ